MEIEPEMYLPVVPLLLINGCVGIGTGFSTKIPPYNPTDLVRVLRDRLQGRLGKLSSIVLKPWWQGFKGPVVAGSDGNWLTKGLWDMDDAKNTITIKELPVGTWTKDYKAYLDEMASVEKLKDGEKIPRSQAAFYTEDGKPLLKGFDDLYTDDEVKFILYFDEDTYEDLKAHPGEIESRFQLSSIFHTSNMVAFNTSGAIEKFSTVGQMLEAYYNARLPKYEERRAKEIARLKAEAVQADAKARFIRAVLEGTMDLRRKSDTDIVAAMLAHDLPPLSPGAEGSADKWEYLLRLRMDRVKAAAVEEAEAAVRRAQAELAELEGTTAGQLWLNDLEEFEAAWQKMIAARAAASVMPAQRKAAPKKPRSAAKKA